MLIVTGATGRLGRLIVGELVKRVGADRVGVSVRDPGKGDDLRGLGVRVRRGDFEDPGSLADAFEGARRVLIVSSNARASGGDAIAQHRNAISAARDAGARRVVYTSHMGASERSAFPPMLDHAATEALLAGCGLPWTALRNGFYAESGLDLMGDAWTTGVVRTPADGKVSWTAHADLAEAAALILADEDAPEGPTPPLTGGEALDLADMASLASGLGERPVRREVLDDDEFRAVMAGRGTPEGATAIALGLYRAARTGEFATVDPALERMIGRRPVTVRDLLAERLGG